MKGSESFLTTVIQLSQECPLPSHHAAGIIFVHNHPSGDAQPSPEDKNLTRSLMEAARTIDLRVLDHLIVGKEGYCSFVESRLMPGS